MTKTPKKRTLSEAQLAANRRNMIKAHATPQTPKMTAAKRSNVRLATAMRMARQILQKIPADAAVGYQFCMSSGRGFELLDAAPQAVGGHWEQRLRQFGSRTIYGVTREFSGVVRIVWDYAPCAKNKLDRPLLDED